MKEKIKQWWDRYASVDMTTVLIGFIIFHFLLTMITVIVLKEKNIFFPLYESGHINRYIIISSFFGSIGYFLIGYLLVLARHDTKDLRKQILILSELFFVILFLVFIVSFIMQYLRPFRVSYKSFVFINYPAARYLVAMDLLKDGKNILIGLSALLPPFFLWLGGIIRIRKIEGE